MIHLASGYDYTPDRAEHTLLIERQAAEQDYRERAGLVEAETRAHLMDLAAEAKAVGDLDMYYVLLDEASNA